MVNEQTTLPRTPLRILPVTQIVTDKRLRKNDLREFGSDGHWRSYTGITKESLETALLPGFFNECVSILDPFDRIELACSVLSERPQHARLVVTAIELVDGTLVTKPDCVPGTTPYETQMKAHGGHRHVHVELLDAKSDA